MTVDERSVGELISRIASAPAASPATSVTSVPDELQRLDDWWRRIGSSRDPAAAWLSPPGVDFAEGVAIAERTIDAGANLLLAHLPDEESTRSRALIGVLCHRDAAAVCFQPGGMSDAQWAVECGRVRDNIAAWIPMRGEPTALLEMAGDAGVTAMVGSLLAAASRRTPVILDGTRVMAAAVIADRLAPQASSWWRAASTSLDPAHAIASDRMDLDAGLPLNVSGGDSRACRATVALMQDMASHKGDPA